MFYNERHQFSRILFDNNFELSTHRAAVRLQCVCDTQVPSYVCDTKYQAMSVIPKYQANVSNIRKMHTPAMSNGQCQSLPPLSLVLKYDLCDCVGSAAHRDSKTTSQWIYS